MSSNNSNQSKPAYITISANIINKFKCCISSNVVDVDRDNTYANSPKSVDMNEINLGDQDSMKTDDVPIDEVIDK